MGATYRIEQPDGSVYQIEMPDEEKVQASVEAPPFVPFAGTSLGAIGQSGARYAGNVAQTILHPLQTLTGLSKMAVGGVEKLIPGQQPQEPYADAVGEFVKQRYGSFEKFKEIWKHDPVGVIADASMVLGGAAGVAGKIGKISALPDVVKAAGITSRVAASVDPMVATLNAAKFAGRIPVRILESSQRGAAAQSINSLIKPANRAFAYGRNPGLAVAQEGIIASSMEDLAAKTAARQEQLGQQIGAVLDDPAIAGNKLNVSNALNPLTIALTKAKQNPRTNAGVIQRLENLRDDLLGVVVNEDGTTTVTKDLTSLTPKEAFNLKKSIGELTRWTANPSEDSIVNAASKQVYAGIRSKIESVVPGIKSLNERYANLLEAANAARNQVFSLQRRQAFGLTDVLLGVAGEMRGGFSGAMMGVLLSQGAKAAIQSPYIRTQLSTWLTHATPTEVNRLFDRVPGLRSEAMRVGLLVGTGQQRVTAQQASPQTQRALVGTQ